MRRLIAFVALVLLAPGCGSGELSKPRASQLSRIVFEKGLRIGVADANGRHWRFLVRGWAPVISPDGRWVAFSGSRGLSVINANGGPIRVLAKDVAYPAVWSPDSRHLAAQIGRSTPPYGELVTADRNRPGVRRIAVAEYFSGFDFSPDGSRLAFARSSAPNERSDVYVARTGGGPVRRVTRDARSTWPVWTPGGSITFSRREGPLGAQAARDTYWGKHRLWLMSAAGADKRVLTKRLRPTLITERLGLQAVAWSQAGGRLLAVSPTHNGEYVYVVDRRGSIRSLGNQGYFGYATADDISRDGRFILLWIQLDGPDSRRTRVELVRTNGGRPRVIARNVGPPSWSR